MTVKWVRVLGMVLAVALALLATVLGVLAAISLTEPPCACVTLPCPCYDAGPPVSRYVFVGACFLTWVLPWVYWRLVTRSVQSSALRDEAQPGRRVRRGTDDGRER